MSKDIEVSILIGEESLPILSELIELSKGYFKKYPFLYGDDNINNQTQFLNEIFTKKIIVAVATHGGKVIGAAINAHPEDLGNNSTYLDKFLYQNSLGMDQVVISVWTIISPKYQGKGIGVQLLDVTEKYCRENNIKCRLMHSIVRSPNDSRAPKSYVSPRTFFLDRMGAVPAALPQTLAEWVDRGDSSPSMKSFEYFVKWL